MSPAVIRLSRARYAMITVATAGLALVYGNGFYTSTLAQAMASTSHNHDPTAITEPINKIENPPARQIFDATKTRPRNNINVTWEKERFVPLTGPYHGHTPQTKQTTEPPPPKYHHKKRHKPTNNDHQPITHSRIPITIHTVTSHNRQAHILNISLNKNQIAKINADR